MKCLYSSLVIAVVHSVVHHIHIRIFIMMPPTKIETHMNKIVLALFAMFPKEKYYKK